MRKRYVISEKPKIFSPGMETLRKKVMARLLPRDKREINDFGPEGDGRTPFLDVFEKYPEWPYPGCLARAIADSWLVSEPFIEEGEIITGIPRPKRPLVEHFAYGINFWKDRLKQPAYAAQSGKFMERLEALSGRINPLTMKHVNDEGIRRMGKEVYYGACESVWSVAGYQGHTVPDFGKLLENGIGGMIAEIDSRRKEHPEAEKKELLDACSAVYKGLSAWIGVYAEHAAALRARAGRRSLRKDLDGIEGTCRAVAFGKPKTLRQAAQLLFFYALWDNIDSLGRCDQYLYPFYRSDIKSGKLDEKGAFEVISALCLKFLEYGVHNITLAGQDPGGKDASNELTYMFLEAARTLHETHPRLSVRIFGGTPEEVMGLSVKMLSEGMSDPTFVNDETAMKGLRHFGVAPDDARNYTVLGCQEIEVPGKSNLGCEDATMNLAKCLELALNDGRCRLTGLQLGVHTGNPAKFGKFGDLWNAYKKQVEYFTRHCIELSNMGVRIRSENLAKLVRMPLTEKCLERGLDPDGGGALYGYGQIETAGIGAAADSLAAARRLVFRDGKITMKELLDALENNFRDGEPLRRLLLDGAPKYGNDDPEADGLARKVAGHFWREIGKYVTPRGGSFSGAVSLLERGVRFGRMTAAMPDGRFAGEPLGNSVGPRTGADKKGPTAMLRSAARIPQYLGAGGTMCNLSLPAALMAEDEQRKKVSALIKGYFSEGGMMVQVTTVDSKTLRKAQKEPGKYSNLIVRVGGYSARFIELDTALQNEIIARN